MITGTDERFAHAIRALLARPLLVRDDPAWLDVVTHRSELVSYFEDLCGWTLNVDVRTGTARLHKRRSNPDPTRAARRPNTERSPMRAEGYATLMLTCAELISRPTTTLGDLADNLAAAALADTTLPDLDATVHSHRVRLVEAVRWLDDAGLLTITAGDLDRYEGGDGDAVIVANTERLALVLSCDTPPSRIDADTVEDWVSALVDEPRYRLVTDGVADAEATARYARHMLARGLLDDPAVLVDRLDPHAIAYLATGSGRPALRRGVARAGFGLEEHADCLVCVDETTEATDSTFGAGNDLVTQVAAAILDHLGPRSHNSATKVDDIVELVEGLLAADPAWARTYQRDGGAGALARAALDVLAGFALIATVGDTDEPTVTPTAVAGRFATTIVDARGDTDPGAPTADEEDR